MSDPIQHECGIALLRLKKPLQYYVDKYGVIYVYPKEFSGAGRIYPWINTL